MVNLAVNDNKWVNSAFNDNKWVNSAINDNKWFNSAINDTKWVYSAINDSKWVSSAVKVTPQLYITTPAMFLFCLNLNRILFLFDSCCEFKPIQL